MNSIILCEGRTDAILLSNYSSEQRFENIVIMGDKDDLDINTIEKKHIQWLSPYVTDMKNGNWIENRFTDNFGNEQKIKTLSIIIPTDKQGALETALLDAISEDTYDKVIVDKCKEFVDIVRPVASKYIRTERLALKAHLSSVFAIRSPEKVFSELDVIIKDVPWEKYETLTECFGVLECL